MQAEVQEGERQERAWHALPLRDVLRELGADERGLSGTEARARRDRFGPNTLPHEPPPAWWQIALSQFRSPLIYVLALAAAVSLALGETTDASFIGAVLALNATIGGFQEWRAERSARALQQLLKIRASVERDGEISEIDAEEVVPGDVVWLESGQRVPADARLLTSHGLEVDESLLTGESLPSGKDPSWQGPEASPLGDRRNMVFAGSAVARGRSRALVVATGASTSVGRLALDVARASGGKPPLIERMERFTRAIAVVVLAGALSVGLLGVLVRGQSVSEMFLFAVALAVSAIPEGLPVAMTVALAIATTRMARRGVIVRKLAAVEGLGSCTLVATDKTGTLTVNAQTVREVRLADGTVLETTGEGFVPDGDVLAGGVPVDATRPDLAGLARVAVLCNEADLHARDGGWVWRGDTVDVAFLAFARKLGWTRGRAIEAYPELGRVPFEPERRFAASYHRADGGVLVAAKGAPERVLDLCAVDEAAAKRHREAAEDLAGRGFRVMALAEGRLADGFVPSDVPPEPSGLVFLGLAGMIDPLRPGVRDAIAECRRAGVDVTMVTGDHPVTALAIARQLELAAHPQEVVTGAQLLTASAETVAGWVRRARVFARVAPDQKLRIVRAAREAGHFVAVTGDGVNDAPALREANIGVSMGKSGTDVAREASEIVISDDDFGTIVAGIEEGRIAYDNIRKVIYLLVSTGAAEIVLVAAAVAGGMPLPLLPVQLLWLNLVTNGIQDVALAFEPGEKDVLRRPPRPPRERIFNRLMLERTIIAAVVMGGVASGVFAALLSAGYSEDTARNLLLLLMVLFENVHIGNCRSETKSALRLSPFRSPVLLFGAATALLLHLLAMHVPLGQRLLAVEPVSAAMLFRMWAIALSIFVAIEVHKWTWGLRRRP